jgi:hypothetical protein
VLQPGGLRRSLGSLGWWGGAAGSGSCPAAAGGGH